MAGATFANGQVYFQNLTARMQPYTLSAYKPGGPTATLLTYDYDARGKVISIIDGAVAGENRTFGYDANGRLLSSTGPWGSGSYIYDALGNMRQRNEGTAGSSTISYDASNRVSQSVVAGLGTRAYVYDARGNTTGVGGQGFTYDYSNQPVALYGAVTASYAYDGNFKRVKEVRSGKTVYTVYSRVSGGLVFRDEATDGVKTEYISAGGAALRLKKTGTAAAVPEYIHTDHLGSPVASTDATGAVTWRESYRPFGKAVRIFGSAPANDNNTGFTGHLEDDASGLVYMQARYYDPLVPRFLSTDPIGYQDQLNLYAYVANDPVNKVDPNGEQSCTAFCMMMGGPVSVNSPSGRAGATYNHAAASAGLTAAGIVAGGTLTTAGAVGAAAIAALAAEAGLAAAGASAGAASLGGVAAQSAVVAMEVQAAVDVGSTGSVNAGNVAKAGAIGAVGGGLVGAIPKAGIGGALARTEVGATIGAVGAVVMNGSETTGGDMVAGAVGGAAGAQNDMVGAAATIATETLRDDDLRN